MQCNKKRVVRVHLNVCPPQLKSKNELNINVICSKTIYTNQYNTVLSVFTLYFSWTQDLDLQVFSL